MQNYSNAVSNSLWQTSLAQFPQWQYGPIKDLITDFNDNLSSYSIFVEADEQKINEYMVTLQNCGFVGDSQIMRKIIDNVEYVVDFSFLNYGDNCEIHYVVIV